MVWNVTVNMSISIVRVSTNRKMKKVVNMPEITFYIVQCPLKLFLSSKKQNYLVKGSHFQVWYHFKKTVKSEGKKNEWLISLKKLSFFAKGIKFFQICELQIKYYLVHLTHCAEKHLMKQCMRVMSIVLKSARFIPVISIWIRRHIKFLCTGGPNNKK